MFYVWIRPTNRPDSWRTVSIRATEAGAIRIMQRYKPADGWFAAVRTKPAPGGWRTPPAVKRRPR